MTINDARNDLINKVTNLTINYAGNDLIGKVAKLTINDAGNDVSRVIASDVQVQFAGNSAGISHQNLLSGRMIRIGQDEVPVLVTLTEPIIFANNKPAMTISTGVIQTPQAPTMPTMQ